MVEKNQLGAAASGVNFGGVRRNGRKLAELGIAARAFAVWKRLPELVGSDCEYAITGNIKIGRSEEDMVQLAAHAEAQTEYGVEVEMLSRNALLDRFPWLGPSAVGAAHCASDGQANPRLVGPAFARAARAAGATLIEHDGAKHVERDGAGFIVETESGRSLRAGALINSAGAWGGRLSREVRRAGRDLADGAADGGHRAHALFHGAGARRAGRRRLCPQIPRGNVIFGAAAAPPTSMSASARSVPRRA